MSRPSSDSRSSTLLALLGVAFLIGVVLLLSSLLHWYRQHVIVNEQTTCSAELTSKVDRFDYYRVTAPMSNGTALKMDLRQPANLTIFRPGRCIIRSWEKLYWAVAKVQDSDGRDWELVATADSTYDPRGAWDFLRYLAPS